MHFNRVICALSPSRSVTCDLTATLRESKCRIPVIPMANCVRSKGTACPLATGSGNRPIVRFVPTCLWFTSLTGKIAQSPGSDCYVEAPRTDCLVPVWLQSPARCSRAPLRCHFYRDNGIAIALVVAFSSRTYRHYGLTRRAIMDNGSTRNEMSDREWRRC